MNRFVATLSTAIALAVALANTPGATQAPPQGRPADTLPAAAGPEPWPDAKALAERRREAENRRLFRSLEPLSFTLIADFRAVNRDRDPKSTRLFPATIVAARTDGTTATVPLQIRTRGHSRRNPVTCSFAPLRLVFQRDQMAGTAFAGHNALKLGTHCRDVNEFEQYVLREYLAYQVYSLLTPKSFRARLAKVTYVNAADNKPIAERYGMLIEDDDDVARRLEGRIIDQQKLLFRNLDQETLTLMLIFEYMIGNTDLSINVQHNVRIVDTPSSGRHPIPYDFDYAGLVDTVYAVADKRLGIQTVRDRLYRGPCRTAEELEPFLAKMRAAKPAILALYENLPDLSNSYRRNAKGYLEEFFRKIDRPREVKRDIIDACVKFGM